MLFLPEHREMKDAMKVREVMKQVRVELCATRGHAVGTTVLDLMAAPAAGFFQ